MSAAAAGEDGVAAVGQFAEHGESVHAGARLGLPSELASGQVVGAKMGPIFPVSAQRFGAGLGGGSCRQIVGGCVNKDNVAFV